MPGQAVAAHRTASVRRHNATVEYGYSWRGRDGRHHRISMGLAGWLILGPFIALAFLIAGIIRLLIKGTVFCGRACGKAGMAVAKAFSDLIRQHT